MAGEPTPSAPTADLTRRVGDRDHLVAAFCDGCGNHTFPAASACPRCGGETTETAAPTSGVVWSWTVQRIRPKPPYAGPAEYEPFALGYVDLGVLSVETPLAGRPVDAWQIGDAVHLVVADSHAHHGAPFWFEADRDAGAA